MADIIARGMAANASASSIVVSLTVAGWSGNSQNVVANGVTVSNIIIVAPSPASQNDYGSAGIQCTAQSENQLTFTCVIIPTSDINVNVVIL